MLPVAPVTDPSSRPPSPLPRNDFPTTLKNHKPFNVNVLVSDIRLMCRLSP